jgi:hypothetical protein
MRAGSETKSAELQWICRSALQAAFPSFRSAEVVATFYPYIGLTHTIRRKESTWVLRISDHCRHAPRAVLEAVAIILGAKILRRRPPRRAESIYEQFRREPVIRELLEARRVRHGRKQISGAEGRHHSLSKIYHEVNSGYFNEQVEIRRIGWGPRRSWNRLGHYDPDHHTITVSPVLDSPRVPAFVVGFIVYHELLHTVFGEALGDARNGRRRHHPPEFRKAEQAHPDYEAAKRFLADFCRRRGRRSRGMC